MAIFINKNAEEIQFSYYTIFYGIEEKLCLSTSINEIEIFKRKTIRVPYMQQQKFVLYINWTE